jgi:aspartate aminotransferase
MLGEIPGIDCPEPVGAFYAYPGVKGVLGKEVAGRRPQASAELAALLLKEVEVAAVPGEAFGANGYFRLSYAMADADLEVGIGRIAKFLAGEAKLSQPREVGESGRCTRRSSPRTHNRYWPRSRPAPG